MPSTIGSSSGLIIVSEWDDPSHGTHIPLTGVRVSARITGPTSRVTVVQSYENREDIPLEATYVFPLEEGSAVCGFAVSIDGHRMQGRVEASDDAFDEYDDAMAEGRGAFLLDQERPDVFTASIGNILPGQKVEVEIEYVAEVPREGKGLRWRLPTTVSPRYVPQSHRDFDGMNDAERINPPTSSEPLSYGMAVQVDVDLGIALASVESPSHKTRVSVDGSSARIELSGDEGLMDRDFVLLIEPKEALAPITAVEQGPDGQSFAVVSFVPRYETERKPVEVVFIVDCSGSMSGTSIEQARRTLRLCLRSLEPGDRFNIIRFGSTHEMFHENSCVYSDETLAKADEWVSKTEANLGGTEMVKPVHAALSKALTKGMMRKIVLLTDGQVANEDELIRMAKEHRESTQFFGFGIGYGASEHLVRGVARAGRGASEMVYPGESIEEKVLRHFDRIAAGVAGDVKLRWEGIAVVDVLPGELPPLWNDEPVTFYAGVQGKASGRAILEASFDGEKKSWVAELDPGETSPAEGVASGSVPALWARHRIRELEESDEWTGLRGSQQSGRKRRREKNRREQAERQLVEVAKRFGLMSAATSYVLVDDRPDAKKAEVRAELRRIPGQMTRGWHGSMTLGASASQTGMFQLFQVASMGKEKPMKCGSSDATDTLGATWMGGSPPQADVDSDMALDMELIFLLTAEGFWQLDKLVGEFVDVPRRKLVKLAKQIPSKRSRELVATLAIIVKVENDNDEIPSMWKPALNKARKWVEKALAEMGAESAVDWEESVREVVGG